MRKFHLNEKLIEKNYKILVLCSKNSSNFNKDSFEEYKNPCKIPHVAIAHKLTYWKLFFTIFFFPVYWLTDNSFLHRVTFSIFFNFRLFPLFCFIIFRSLLIFFFLFSSFSFIHCSLSLLYSFSRFFLLFSCSLFLFPINLFFITLLLVLPNWPKFSERLQPVEIHLKTSLLESKF